MSIRNVIWTVSEDGRSLFPNAPQYGGVQGEHNATTLIFNIPETCPLRDEKYRLYISCVDTTGAYDKSPALLIEDGKVSFDLPRAWTQFGGYNELRLVAEAVAEIALELKARVVYDSRQRATQAEKKLLDGFMQAAVDRAENASESAARSAEEAKRYAEQAQTGGAGGGGGGYAEIVDGVLCVTGGSITAEIDNDVLFVR